jgi:chromosome segregation ATPase
MAKVEIDLSEYDMMREAKKAAESRVEELSKEVENLKSNSKDVVIKNRYYIPTVNYMQAARRIIENLGTDIVASISQTVTYEKQQMDRYGGFLAGERLNLSAWDRYGALLTDIVKRSLQGLFDLKSGYREDGEVVEVRGLDEIREPIKAKLEEEYRLTLEQKRQDLEISKDAYEKKLEETGKEIDKLKKKYEKELETRDQKIDSLNENLNEALKSNEEKLKEALTKLHEAEAEVAKYQTSRKKIFGIF